MFIKVCGITSAQQAREISKRVDYIGYIFHPKSPRYIAHSFPSLGAQKVGVFVNIPLQKLIRMALLEKLNAVQLHGEETPEYCAALKNQITVIKSFGIHPNFDFDELHPYSTHVDYFLFDTRTVLHGGSGKTFDWSILTRYEGETPFILSGGIHPNLVSEIQSFKHSKLKGIDLNSGFEIQPGVKNISVLNTFLHDIKK